MREWRSQAGYKVRNAIFEGKNPRKKIFRARRSVTEITRIAPVAGRAVAVDRRLPRPESHGGSRRDYDARRRNGQAERSVVVVIQYCGQEITGVASASPSHRADLAPVLLDVRGEIVDVVHQRIPVRRDAGGPEKLRPHRDADGDDDDPDDDQE